MVPLDKWDQGEDVRFGDAAWVQQAATYSAGNRAYENVESLRRTPNEPVPFSLSPFSLRLNHTFSKNRQNCPGENGQMRGNVSCYAVRANAR